MCLLLDRAERPFRNSRKVQTSTAFKGKGTIFFVASSDFFCRLKKSKKKYSFGSLGCLFTVLKMPQKANTLNCRYNNIPRAFRRRKFGKESASADTEHPLPPVPSLKKRGHRLHRFSSAIYYIMEKTKTTIRMKTMKTECRADMLQNLTSRKIREIAMWQSAIDLNCAPGDFLMEENRLAISEPDPRARRYLSLPFECNLVSYGSNIVASVSEATRETVKSYIETYPMEHCFETPNLHILNEALSKFDLAVCFMAEYFLPELNCLKMRACKYHLKLLEPPDFQSLYQPQWSHALCEQRKHSTFWAWEPTTKTG